MKKFRVPMHCKKCGKLLGYKSYSDKAEREEPMRFCPECQKAEAKKPDLSSMTVKELRAMAKEKGAVAAQDLNRMRKADLMKALEDK